MQLSTLRPSIARRCRAERGFTVLLALMVLLITSVLLGGAYVAVVNDTHLSRNDLDQKRAYAAAQAGLQAYNYQLNQDPNYWTSCNAVSNVAVPGSTDAGVTETYSYKPIPASGQSACDATSSSTAITTMIEPGTLSGGAINPAAGTFRISSTGTSGANASRTIVAQYRRSSFLNYVYYTDYEILDPAASSPPPSDCAVHYPPSRPGDCQVIEFVTGDSINGPLHSEDTLLVCGSPVFGRRLADQIEAPAHSNEGIGGCTDSATMTGHFNTAAPSLLPPPSNSQILNVAQAGGDVFIGKTTIVLNATTITVTNAAAGDNNTVLPWPTNGVVYVSTSNAGCAVTYTPFGSDYANTSCGNAYVSSSGTGYTKSLTIASDNDIIINGNILTPNSAGVPTGNALLGLVANDFVRIYHPLSGSRGSGTSCGSATNGGGALTSPTIYAAILAVNHSFIVDNYDCGASLGTLSVTGAIAQLYRGPVGTGSSSSGYLKSYNYDDRLAETEPPYFLNPVSAAWSAQRQTECAATSASC